MVDPTAAAEFMRRGLSLGMTTGLDRACFESARSFCKSLCALTGDPRCAPLQVYWTVATLCFKLVGETLGESAMLPGSGRCS